MVSPESVLDKVKDEDVLGNFVRWVLEDVFGKQLIVVIEKFMYE